MYAIVDVETTGRAAPYGKIIEIAIYLHDGKNVYLNYSTLINPKQAIPRIITELTGITNEMVKFAPTFAEVADDITLLLKDFVFVAHNVEFDHSFIQEEFRRINRPFEAKQKVCTCRLSRKIFRGLPSYSLGNLCQSLKIGFRYRHRAGGDAEATARLFSKLLKHDAFELIPMNKFIKMDGQLPIFFEQVA